MAYFFIYGLVPLITVFFHQYLRFFRKSSKFFLTSFWLKKTRRLTWICQFLVKPNKKLYILAQSGRFSYFRFWKCVTKKKKWSQHFVKLFVLNIYKKKLFQFDVYYWSYFDFLYLKKNKLPKLKFLWILMFLWIFFGRNVLPVY